MAMMNFKYTKSSIRKSIGWKLGVLMVALATGLSIAQIFIFTAYDTRTELQNKREELKTIAEIVGANGVPALKFNDREDALEILSSLKAYPTMKSAYLLNMKGGVLAEYLRAGETLEAPVISLQNEFQKIQSDTLAVLHKVRFQGKLLGGLYLISDLSDFAERRAAASLRGSVVGITFFFLSVLLAYQFQKFLTHPIKELGSTMQRITLNKNFTERAEKSSIREFQLLEDSFNSMLEQIEKKDQELADKINQLERANKELDQFVYVASHDLKAPLRAVENLARLVERATQELLPPDKHEYLELMQSRVKRMEALLDDLLSYSRVGRVATPVVTVDCNQLLRDIVALFDPPVSFTISIQNNLPVLRAQRAPLEQVFRNLIGNALKHHGRPEGKIVITGIDEGEYIRFAVSDDGPGIPAEYHEKVFQMFQTLKPRDEVEGSGMGLALVKKVVEDQGGQVTLQSEVGKGSCFTFTWPTYRVSQGKSTLHAKNGEQKNELQECQHPSC